MTDRGELLAKLKELHTELLELVAELAAGLASEPPTSDGTLTGMRWKLSRASRNRSMLVENDILPLLLECASQSEKDQLAELRNALRESSSRSSQHVAAWSGKTVATDRLGYRHASEAIQLEMRARIDREKRVLYPLLERHRL